eukprot:g2650.t1
METPGPDKKDMEMVEIKIDRFETAEGDDSSGETISLRSDIEDDVDENDSNAPVCYICWENEAESEKRLIKSPCECSGTSGFVHKECLQTWLDSQTVTTNERPRCPSCAVEYHNAYVTQDQRMEAIPFYKSAISLVLALITMVASAIGIVLIIIAVEADRNYTHSMVYLSAFLVFLVGVIIMTWFLMTCHYPPFSSPYRSKILNLSVCGSLVYIFILFGALNTVGLTAIINIASTENSELNATQRTFLCILIAPANIIWNLLMFWYLTNVMKLIKHEGFNATTHWLVIIPEENSNSNGCGADGGIIDSNSSAGESDELPPQQHLTSNFKDNSKGIPVVPINDNRAAVVSCHKNEESSNFLHHPQACVD